MEYRISVPRGTSYYTFSLLPYDNYQKVIVEGVVVFNIVKHHNHRYVLDAFFYASHRIYSGYSFKTKKELFGAIQKLLQKELYVDVQNASGV